MIFGLDILGFIAWIEINLPLIIPTIAAVLPSIAAVFTIICACFKLLHDNRYELKAIIDQFNELRQEVRDKTEIKQTRAEMKQIIHDNAVLRKQNTEILAQLSRIKPQEAPNENK